MQGCRFFISTNLRIAIRIASIINIFHSSVKPRPDRHVLRPSYICLPFREGKPPQAVEGFLTETFFTIFQLHATNEIDFSYFIILREQLHRFFQKGRSTPLVFSGFLSVFHTTNTIGAYTKIMLRKGHVTSSNRPAYTPMQDGIPNNPYIIAKNAPHPGAFFVAFFQIHTRKQPVTGDRKVKNLLGTPAAGCFCVVLFQIGVQDSSASPIFPMKRSSSHASRASTTPSALKSQFAIDCACKSGKSWSR